MVGVDDRCSRRDPQAARRQPKRVVGTGGDTVSATRATTEKLLLFNCTGWSENWDRARLLPRRELGRRNRIDRDTRYRANWLAGPANWGSSVALSLDAGTPDDSIRGVSDFG